MSTGINEHNVFSMSDVSKMLNALDKRIDSECEIILFQELSDYLSNKENNRYTTNKSIKCQDTSKHEVDQTWTLCDIATLKAPVYWKDFFTNNVELLNDIDFVIKRDKLEDDFIVPMKKNIFKCFEICKPEDIKVIIFSSKPYTSMCPVSGEPLATGTSFSVPKGSPQTKALKNIVTCISNMCINEYKEDEKILEKLHKKYMNKEDFSSIFENFETIETLFNKYVRKSNTEEKLELKVPTKQSEYEDYEKYRAEINVNNKNLLWL